MGITFVAIGFAFKDVLQNFLAGILILWRRPFVVGDQIEFKGLYIIAARPAANHQFATRARLERAAFVLHFVWIFRCSPGSSGCRRNFYAYSIALR